MTPDLPPAEDTADLFLILTLAILMFTEQAIDGLGQLFTPLLPVLLIFGTRVIITAGFVPRLAGMVAWG